MVQPLWDSSALLKRYFAETGSDTVDALFDSKDVTAHRSASMCYAETAALLRRKRNGGEISQKNYEDARAELEAEVFDNLNFVLFPFSDAPIFAGIALAERHNINSTDAAILALFLEYARSLPPDAPRCVLVATDRHLLRAASVEGLLTLNPHFVVVDDLPTFLAQLH